MIENMLIVEEKNRLTWKDLLVIDNIFIKQKKPLIVSDSINIGSKRNRSISISFNSNLLCDELEEANDYNYSSSAPSFKLSNSLHDNYIDIKMNQKKNNIKQSSSSNNLNYHNMIGESPEKNTVSTFGYYYNKIFSSKNKNIN